MKDRLEITVRSGRGGDGCVGFRREKYVPRGGPDGGDGARGGHVFVRGRDKLESLDQLRHHALYAAPDGAPGTGGRMTGKTGEDVYIDVPLGTSVIDADTEAVLGEILTNGEKLLVAEGGAGGRGNWHFATPQNRVPIEFEPGIEGIEREIVLEYCIPADVAVIGLGNSGKSSLVRAITRSQTRIEPYPFSTRKVGIGVCNYGEYLAFSIIDTPALIEGAHEGRGLGNKFLRHLTRVSTILLLLDPANDESISPADQLATLMSEVEIYNDDFISKTFVVASSKSDIAKLKGVTKRLLAKYGIETPVLSFSSLTRDGIDQLVPALAEIVDSQRVAPEPPTPVQPPDFGNPDEWEKA